MTRQDMLFAMWILSVLCGIGATEAAEYSGLRITPQLNADYDLTAELLNLSKLTLHVRVATVNVGTTATGARCDLQLPADVTIVPAGTIVMKFAEGPRLLECIKKAQGVEVKRLAAPLVLTEATVNLPSVRQRLPSQAKLQPIDVTVLLDVGERRSSTKAQWHIPYE